MINRITQDIEMTAHWL